METPEEITQPKRAEDALRESEEKYRMLFETMAQGAVYQNAEGHIISANPAAERLLGLTLAQMLGRTSMDPRWKAIHEDGSDFPGDTHAAMIALKTGKEVSHVVMGVFHPGAKQYVWINVHAVPQFRPGETKPYQVYTTFDDITERKRAEEQIQSLSRFPAENPNPVLRLQRDGTLIYANPSARPLLQLWGCEVGQRVRADWARLVADSMASGAGKEVEVACDQRVYSFILAPIQTADYVNAYGRDITERKQAQKAVQESEERLRTIVEASLDAIVAVNAEGQIVLFNDAAQDLFQYSKEDALKQPAKILLREEMGQIHQERLERFLNTGVGRCGHIGRRMEKVFRRKDGSLFEGEVSMSGGRLDGLRLVVLAVHDITARKRTEQALQESEEKYRRLFSQASDALLILDLETHRFLDTNETASQLYGYTHEEFLGLRAEDISGEPEQTAAALRELEEKRSIRVPVHWHRKKDGTIFPVDLSARPFLWKGHQVSCVFIRDITERKRAEEQIQSLSRFPAENPNPVLRLQRDGTLIYANPGARPLLQLWGCEVGQRVPADWARHVADSMASGAGKEVEVACDQRVYSFILAPIQTAGYVNAYGRDITERKQAEEALKFTQFSLNNAADTMVCVGRDARFIDVNDAFCRSSGYSREELLSMTVHDIDPDYSAEIWSEFWEKLKQSGSLTFESRLRTEGGKVLPVEITATLFEYKGKEYHCSFARDITERKRVEQALRESEERFRSLVENATVGIYRTTPEGRILMANLALVRMLGHESFQALATRDLEQEGFEPTYPRSAFRERIEREGEVTGLEAAWKRRDGSTIYVRESAHAVRAGDGRVLYYDGIVEDVTERKHLEEQFRQAQKMEAVGRLAGGVAHDFNNILMAVNGYAQLVLRRLSPRHPVRQQVNEIRKAGERAANLTRQLLAFSRRQILVPRILDLNKVVADTKEMLRRVIGEDVELVIRQGHKLAKVLADPSQIAEVLVNLAVNARGAMPGGGRLTIETGNVDLREAETGDLPDVTPGPYVMLAVSDTGVGMSKEVMEHMFEPFFTTREQGKGTGLGLSIVHGVVKQSDGHVRAQSEPGHGSTFRIYLPCAQVGSGKPAARSTKARLAKGRGTVLVVEDELAVRQVVAAALRSSGYKVLEAGSGEEAMRRLRRHEGPLHLLLTDLVMPRMNGRQLADSVRTLYPEVEVLFMSGYTDDVLLRQGGSDAQRSFLQKPFTMEVLTQKVREALKPSQ